MRIRKVNQSLDGVISGYVSYGDDEVRARIAEEGDLEYCVDKDWANPGCQSMKPRGPMVDLPKKEK